jgi:hypothetical protein
MTQSKTTKRAIKARRVEVDVACILRSLGILGGKR